MHTPAYSSPSNRPPYHGFRDNLTVVSERYMKMIKRCTLEVRLASFSSSPAKEAYLYYYKKLATFATYFGGDNHSLQKMAIYFSNCFIVGYYYPSKCLRRVQNVLETLAAIYAVRDSVTIEGVTPALEGILSLAMTSKKIAFVPKEEIYGERTIKFKGKKRLQKYKLEPYYEEKIVWNRTVLALDPSRLQQEKALLEYGLKCKCCEVCDSELPLTLL